LFRDVNQTWNGNPLTGRVNSKDQKSKITTTPKGKLELNYTPKQFPSWRFNTSFKSRAKNF